MKTGNSFARELAQAYHGRVKRDEFETPGVTRCEFRVDGTHRGRPLRFWVFDDGCVVEGATTQRMALAVAFNGAFARVDKRVKDGLPAGAMPVFRVRNIREGQDFPTETLVLASLLRLIRVVRRHCRQRWPSDCYSRGQIVRAEAID